MSSNVTPSVEPIPMGGTYAPLNSTLPNLALSTANGGTSGRHTLTVGSALSYVFDTGARTIRFEPAVVPSGVMFIKRHTATYTTAASATNFDEVLKEGDAAGKMLGIKTNVTGYSIYSATTGQTVYTIEN